METTVKEIADMLKIRKNIYKRTVLFLGARAGGLFRNLKLHGYVEKYSISSFYKLSDTEKFAECYKVLSDQDRFSESNIYDILSAALKDEPEKDEPHIGYRREDDCLVELVKEGYFDIIISTNIDMLLEDTFIREKMRFPHFRVHIHDGLLAPDEEIVRNETKYCTMVKVFGDLGSRKYTTAGNEFNLDKDKRLKQFLDTTLARDVLMIGYDPKWDGPIERAFPTQGGEIWFVNEEEPLKTSFIALAMNRSKSKYLHGWQGSYSKFVRDLHEQIMHREPLNYDTALAISMRLENIDNGMTDLQKEMAGLRADLQKFLASKEKSVHQNQTQAEQ